MLALLRNYSTIHSAYMRRQISADLSRQLATAQKELSTGFKEDPFKDLGTTATEALSLRATINSDDAQIKSNDLLINRMDTMTSSMSSIRETVQGALEIGIANRTGPLGTVSGMQSAARAALEAVLAKANTSHAGVPLFGGVDSSSRPLQPWTKTHPDTGKSPRDVFDEILSGGMATPADTQARVDEVAAAFADTSGTAGWNFSETFYNGAGPTAPRQEAAIGDGAMIDYGVQAGDQAFRKIIQGLAMLASADADQIKDLDSYETWVGSAVDVLASGQTELLEAETWLGAQTAQVETTNQHMLDRKDLYQSRVLDLEGIDAYDAATRISLLETQLQASYAVTARLSQLSFLSYMR